MSTITGFSIVLPPHKSNNIFYGLADDNWDGVSYVDEVTIKPPYYWRP